MLSQTNYQQLSSALSWFDPENAAKKKELKLSHQLCKGDNTLIF
jgi:hypothetical protein